MCFFALDLETAVMLLQSTDIKTGYNTPESSWSLDWK